MAKQRYETVEMEERAPAQVEIELERAWLLDAGDGTVRLRLGGLRLAEVDWQAVGQVFAQAGIPPEDADVLLNRFANETQEHLLAKALAKRVKRVG